VDDLSNLINAYKEQAEQEAQNLRLLHQLGIRGIKDIFQFIDQTLGYLLIRYPFGKDSLQGFASVHTGERLIVTNSSLILSRERFTAAHELGHHIFDIDPEKPKLIHDNVIGKFDVQNLIEYRADVFAANFLMPEEGIKKALKELKKNFDEIHYFDVIKLQIEFGVSYKAMVRRLKDIGAITHEKAQELFQYYPNVGMRLQNLFKHIGADTSLLTSQEVVQIPMKYLKYLQSNFENGYIPYSVLQKVLSEINKTPEETGFEKKSEIIEDEDICIDSLLEEFE
jgi:Zn-dependent peptidase ImmA (M78 family)